MKLAPSYGIWIAPLAFVGIFLLVLIVGMLSATLFGLLAVELAVSLTREQGAGLAHILAVSGQNVMLLAALGAWLGWKMLLPIVLMAAVVGAVVGGLAGKGIAEQIDPTREDAYWRDNYSSRPYVSGGSYDDYGPAYSYGVDNYAKMGGDPGRINPLQPVELVIDHSVAVTFFGNNQAFKKNVDEEYRQNQERYKFLKWAQRSFDNFSVVPPGTGVPNSCAICSTSSRCIALFASRAPERSPARARCPASRTAIGARAACAAFAPPG